MVFDFGDKTNSRVPYGGKNVLIVLVVRIKTLTHFPHSLPSTSFSISLSSKSFIFLPFSLASTISSTFELPTMFAPQN